MHSDVIRHAAEYRRKHLNPVIVISSGVLFARKGTKSVRLSDVIVLNEKQTKSCVERYLGQMS